MRLHAAVAAMFFAFGIGAGLWGGASGVILIRAGVDAATFGVLLTVYTGAYLIAMSAGGAVAHRFGVGQALSVSAIIFGAALCALLNASSEAWVAIALIVSGFIGGVVDLLMNAEGARIERRLGRPILARLHAAASAGMAFGAILSRDSWRGQRIGDALAVEIDDGVMDGLVERGDVCEGLVGEVMGLKIAPDWLDFVEFRGVFWQPLDGEPVCADGQGGERAFAGMDRTIVLDQHDWLGLSPGLRSKETVELLQMGDEIAAALGRARVDDKLAREVIERPQHRDLLGLPRRRHTQVRPRLRPGAGEIGMGQRLALIAVEKNNVSGLGLLFAQLQAQAYPFHFAFRLASLQRVPGPSPAKVFFRKAFDSCERLMRTPSRASISVRRRAIVQLRRSATGSSSKGMATRKAASLFTAGGPGGMLAFSAATPPAAKSLRHRRTVSSRTPNASAILGLVHPASVKSTARARSASPRSRDSERAKRPARCLSLAVTGDFPAMPYTFRIGAGREPQKTYPLVTQMESA
jgi:hypothetical protein